MPPCHPGGRPLRQAAACATLLLAYPAVRAAEPASAPAPVPTLAPISVSAPFPGLAGPLATGSLLELTPMQTPASVEAISREQLEQRGDASVADAVSRATGMSSLAHPGNGGSALAARGFTGSTSVMQLYDGVRQYGGVGITFPFDTWSIERIEVLRGPASVIYGEGAIGGVVNVVPKKPEPGPVRSEAMMAVGSDDIQRLGLGSTGSITDRLSYRLDASGNHGGGWVDRGSSRNATVSAALRLDVTPGLDVTLSHAQGYQEPMRYFGVPTVAGSLDPSLREKNYNVGDGLIAYRDRRTELRANWRPDARVSVDARLYHVASDRHWRNAEYATWLPDSGLVRRTSYTEILHDQSQTGAMATVAVEDTVLGMKNRYAVGLDLNASAFKHSNNSPYGGSSIVDPYDTARGRFFSADATLPKYRNKAGQYAFFAENRLQVNDGLSVLAGMRYDHARVSRDNLLSGRTELRKTFSDVGWRLGAVYDLTPGLAAYAQYSEAADPVNAILMLNPSGKDADLARARQVEIGLKRQFWDGDGEWTLAGYHIVKKDLLTRDASDPSRSVQVGRQSSRGIEASLAVTLARDWRIEANAALLRARYDDFSEAQDGRAVSRKGNVPPDVPERLANLWLTWRFAPDWEAGLGLRYVGRRYADRANRLEMPSYTVTDFSLRWEPRKDTAVALRAYNVFDRYYAQTAYYNATQWLVGPGRQVELAVTHRF